VQQTEWSRRCAWSPNHEFVGSGCRHRIVGDSVGISDGKLVSSLYGSHFKSLGQSVGKIVCKNFHVIEPFFFKKILYILFVIHSVYIDGMILL